MTDPLFWVGVVLGVLIGVFLGVFVVGLMLATRAEHEKTGH